MIVIMGVSGSGKTTLGKSISTQTKIPFYDADDFHSDFNKKKMIKGNPLSDEDRELWLTVLSKKISHWSKKGETILACSALKEDYRKKLMINNSINWIFLEGSFEQISHRLLNREKHFFNTKLLKSQYDILEIPSYATHLKCDKSVDELSDFVIKKLKLNTQTSIGLIGLGIMGQGIALNIAKHNFKISVYNRTNHGEEKIVNQFLDTHTNYKNIIGFTKIKSFIESIKRPRMVWLMIKSGKAIDLIIKEILPYLNSGDVVIDGGNSHYSDTQRRLIELKKNNIYFSGCGVSGGQKGAQHGASLMFGGNSKAYNLISPVLNVIAAKDINGNPCQGYMGDDGAGHFVKMVHNGIEYAEMQILAETFSVLKNQMTYSEIVIFFKNINKGFDSSYLLEITIKILQKKEGDQHLIDLILDQASNKGTGMWSTKTALDLEEVNTMISSAVFARHLSSMNIQRSDISSGKSIPKQDSTIDLQTIKKAYRFARLVNHIQGFNLIEKASKKYNWIYNPQEIARVWTKGCIIRSKLMEKLIFFFKDEKSLLKNYSCIDILTKTEENIASLMHHGIDQKIPIDSYSNAYNYWISLCSKNLPANLIQAQRDFFGAHTYHRNDKPFDQSFHTKWD